MRAMPRVLRRHANSAHRRAFRFVAGPTMTGTGDTRGIARMARSYESVASFAPIHCCGLRPQPGNPPCRPRV